MSLVLEVAYHRLTLRPTAAEAGDVCVLLVELLPGLRPGQPSQRRRLHCFGNDALAEMRHIATVLQQPVDGDSADKSPIRAFLRHGHIDIRCVVVAAPAECDSFTAGLDLADAHLHRLLGGGAGGEVDIGRRALAIHQLVQRWQEAFTQWERVPMPVIALVNGACIGAGVDLITACDIRLCTDDVVVGVREVRVGIAADLGTLQRIERVTGNCSLVREWCLSGRDVHAAEALAAGLFSRRFSTRAAMSDYAMALAIEIAACSPVAVSLTKRVLGHARDHTVQDGLDFVAAWNASALQCHDVVAAMAAAASRSKSPPKFARL